MQVVRFSCFFAVKRYDAVCIWTDKNLKMAKNESLGRKKFSSGVLLKTQFGEKKGHWQDDGEENWRRKMRE